MLVAKMAEEIRGALLDEVRSFDMTKLNSKLRIVDTLTGKDAKHHTFEVTINKLDDMTVDEVRTTSRGRIYQTVMQVRDTLANVKKVGVCSIDVSKMILDNGACVTIDVAIKQIEK